MQHILLPTDFSKNAWNALTYVLELFKSRKCTFYLLHVDTIAAYIAAESYLGTDTKGIRAVLHKESKDQLQELHSAIAALPFAKQHNIISLTEYGFFVETLKKVVQTHSIDLIAMGTKGASGVKEMSVGSNTADVLTKIQVPLLAIPENTTYAPPKEIVLPTDYHTGYEVKVLDTLLLFAALYGSHIRVLHISKKGEQLTPEQIKNKDFLKDYLVHTAHSFHSLTGTDLETAVQCFTERRDIDMIAMVAKNLNFFQRILFRPNVETISYHTKVPFLVLHE